MRLPGFVDRVPRVRTVDPLAAMLGSAEDGILEYGYGDAVRTAGHSCPSVACAYWLGARSLGALYPDGLPERGRIEVRFRGAIDEGTTGVVARIVGLLTGAASSDGFMGIGGRYCRRNLMLFGAPIDTQMRMTRLDTGASVDADSWPQRVEVDPEIPKLMQCVLSGAADPTQRIAFGRLWQERVRRILLEHAHDDAVFAVRAYSGPGTPAGEAHLSGGTR